MKSRPRIIKQLAGGSYFIPPREIAAGATAVFDIRRLRDEQAPDSTGRTLPPTFTIGQIRWSVHGDDSTRLIGRAEVVSARGRVSNSYSCMCCPDSLHSVRVIPERVTVVVGDTPQFFAMQRDMDCYGGVFGEYGASAYYTSGDDSIASVGYWTGLATAIGSGVSYVQGTWTAYEWREDLHGTCESTPVEMTPIADMLVQPEITDISPSRGLVGNTVNVTITGRGFRSDQTSVDAGANIAVSISSVNPTTIQASFAIDINAAGGNRSVTVNVGGMPSGSRNFFVQIPNAFTATSVTQADGGCPANFSGYGAQVLYQVVDQESQPITKAGMTPEEFVTFPDGGQGSAQYEPFATPPTTDASGRFVDIPIVTCFRSDLGSNPCRDVRQEFRIRIPTSSGEQLYFLPTVTTRRDCRLGIRVTVTTGVSSQTFTLGTVN